MKYSITLTKYDDNTILVSSNTEIEGTVSKFNKIKDENKQMMIALADFLGYEPSHILDFSGIMEYEFEDDEDQEKTMKVHGICKDCAFRGQKGAKGMPQHLYCNRPGCGRVIKNIHMKNCDYYQKANEKQMRAIRLRARA